MHPVALQLRSARGARALLRRLREVAVVKRAGGGGVRKEASVQREINGQHTDRVERVP